MEEVLKKLNEALAAATDDFERESINGCIREIKDHLGLSVNGGIINAYCPTCCGHCDEFESKCVTKDFRKWCVANGIKFTYYRDDAKFISAKKKYKLGNALVPVLLSLDEDGAKLAQLSFREGQEINGYVVPAESDWTPQELEFAVTAMLEC